MSSKTGQQRIKRREKSCKMDRLSNPALMQQFTVFGPIIYGIPAKQAVEKVQGNFRNFIFYVVDLVSQ
ncbi:hypothetical protein DQX05_25600 [Paenibacillus thiaminolyticus]|uniref:Uncharacterized protein n=1 Tax=Paenibacillus thiaminolyticus TaxID=49283 RepID=A0A3A3GF72_PANTH|nr:hypothetical protein DQX05_25600 [Paenibacillus thiaminolyticus]